MAELTWTDSTAAGVCSTAMAGQLMVGQVVRYDQEPAWGAFLRGHRVGVGRVATAEEAKERVAKAWDGLKRRRT